MHNCCCCCFSVLPVCVTFLMKTDTYQSPWISQHLPTTTRQRHLKCYGCLPSAQTNRGVAQTSPLASWAPCGDLGPWSHVQRQSCWSCRKQLSHPSSCFFPPLGRPRPNKQLCQHNAAGGMGTRAGNEEGCLNRWRNAYGGVVKCWSSLRRCLHAARQHKHTVALQYQFSPSFLGTAWAEWKDKAPYDRCAFFAVPGNAEENFLPKCTDRTSTTGSSFRTKGSRRQISCGQESKFWFAGNTREHWTCSIGLVVWQKAGRPLTLHNQSKNLINNQLGLVSNSLVPCNSDLHRLLWRILKYILLFSTLG